MNYGVNSTPLGQDRVEPDGRDAGFYERGERNGDLRLLRRDHASPTVGLGPGALLPDVRLPRRPAIPIRS